MLPAPFFIQIYKKVYKTALTNYKQSRASWHTHTHIRTDRWREREREIESREREREMHTYKT